MSQKGFPSLVLTLLVCLGTPAITFAQLAPYQVMHALTGDEGDGPQSGLVRGADNRLYGTATYGGPEGDGTIYSVGTDGTFQVVHTFLTTAAEFGINPVGLIRGRDKNLYGTTEFGGMLRNGSIYDGDGNPVGDGVVYRLNWNESTLTYSGIDIIHTFDCGINEGGDPWGALIEGPDGALYGVTNPTPIPDSGCTADSTVFKVNKDGTGFAILARFNYQITGSFQFGPLVFGTDGSIFGTLIDSLNPAFAFGSIFKVAPDGTVTYPKVFEGADGAYPYSGLVRGEDGAFYGTTNGGGDNGVGTIFRIEENGNFTSLYSFDATSIYSPSSALTAGGDGKLYGAAHEGGATGNGGSYIFDPPAPIGTGGGFTLHAEFDNVNTGSAPWGVLGVGSDRHLYGTQAFGGAGNQGTLFGLLDIEVANRAPVPVALTFPNPAVALSHAGATVELNALGSWDADFDDLTYSWTLPSEATIVDEAADHSTVDARFPEGTWNVTLTVSDGVATRFVTIQVSVTDAPPTFSSVSPISVPATSPTGAVVTFPLPIATDLVDSASGEGNSPVSCVPASGTEFPIGSTEVVCTASDLSGHVATMSFTVTVTASVLLNTPPNQTVEATGPGGATVNYAATATSAAGDPLEPTCSHAPGMFPLGTTTVTCEALDPVSGVTATGSFDLVVVDTTAPQINPSLTEFNATGPLGALAPYIVTAVDAVDMDVTLVCTPPPGGLFPLGNTRITCEAQDDSGNESVLSFDVAVRDSDFPVLTLPAPIVIEAQSAAGTLVTYAVSATDATNPTGVTVSCTPASDTTFVLGTTTVNCTADDGAAHLTNGSFTVTVHDTTPPAISGVPASVTVQATSPGGATVTYTLPTASDLVNGATAVSCTPPPGSTFALGTTTVQCSTSDAAANTRSAGFTVTVVDTAGPVITVPADIVVVTATLTGVPVTYTVTATDIMDGPRDVTCTPPSGSTFPVNDTTIVNCTSADTRGNTSQKSFTVTVVTKPPSLTVTLSPGVLWPPNHKMVTIRATIVATSEAGPAPIVTLVSITSNEPDNGLGDGDTANDIQGAAYGTGDRVFQVRAERAAKGSGRVYTVTYKAASPLNPSIATLVTATVTVPHDMRDKK